MKSYLFALLMLALPTLAHAQGSATPSSHLAWDQDAPDLATAQSYVYRHYDDGSTTGAILTPVVCSGAATPFVCVAPFPAETPGNHTLVATAANAAGESLPSAPLTFTFVVIPNPPRNLRLVP